MRFTKAIAGALGFALLAVQPAAAEYPDKPIRIMAPYAPGGNIDVTARIIADKLRDVLGVTVLVENKAGASGMIGGDVVARSAGSPARRRGSAADGPRGGGRDQPPSARHR